MNIVATISGLSVIGVFAIMVGIQIKNFISQKRDDSRDHSSTNPNSKNIGNPVIATSRHAAH